MQIIDEWRNANKERVVMTDTGRLMVLNERGQPVAGAALNARRCDRAPHVVHNTGAVVAQNAAVVQQIRAYEEEVKRHPGLRVVVNEMTGEVMAACLAPMPYFAKKK